MYICKYFTIKELVSPQVYKKFGEGAWMFFDENILRDLDKIRMTWGKPIIINNGKSFTESGLRDNLCTLVKGKKTLYLSAHLMGKAFDLKDKGGDHAGLWNHCYKMISNGGLTIFKRLEDRASAPTWVHIDSYRTPNGKLRVFKG